MLGKLLRKDVTQTLPAWRACGSSTPGTPTGLLPPVKRPNLLRDEDDLDGARGRHPQGGRDGEPRGLLRVGGHRAAAGSGG